MKRRIANHAELPQTKLLLTVEEAAILLSVGRTLVYDLVMHNQIFSVKIGRTRRIPYAALESFVAQRMQEQEAC